MTFPTKSTRTRVTCGVLLFGGIVACLPLAAPAAEPPAAPAQAATTAGVVAPSAAEARPLAVGGKVPDASLLTASGQPFSLREAVARQPTVLIFYRGGWCPFCNTHLSQLQTIVDELKGLNYQILAVTPDLPSNVADVAAKDHLSYTLLSDPRGEAMKGFGVAYRLDDGTFQKYRDAYKLDLEKWSGNQAHLLPVPSVFVLDTSGTVRFVHADPDYKVRLAPEKVVAAARDAR